MVLSLLVADPMRAVEKKLQIFCAQASIAVGQAVSPRTPAAAPKIVSHWTLTLPEAPNRPIHVPKEWCLTWEALNLVRHRRCVDKGAGSSIG